MKHLLLLICLTGCVNQACLDTCPAYFKENIGQVKYQPWNPLGLLFRGLVQTTDPNGTIYLYILADDDVLLEEAFHSFEIRAGHNRYEEWERFYLDFHNGDRDAYKKYGGVLLNVLIMADGIFGCFRQDVSHFEDTAYHFAKLMNKQPIGSFKTEAVERFIVGDLK